MLIRLVQYFCNVDQPDLYTHAVLRNQAPKSDAAVLADVDLEFGRCEIHHATC